MSVENRIDTIEDAFAISETVAEKLGNTQISVSTVNCRQDRQPLNLNSVDEGMCVTVIEVDIESWIKNPAVRSSGDIYLIQGNKVIGEMRMQSAMSFIGGGIAYQHVSVEPADDVTREFFKDDIGWIYGNLYNLRYSGLTGDPYILHDEDEGRHKDTRIVDKMYFDFGICHPSFKDVEGFANYHKKPKPRHHVPQKHRRPRNSNKIKKVK
jgi:hypothetical protein